MEEVQICTRLLKQAANSIRSARAIRFFVEKLGVAADETVTFNEVVAVGEGSDLKVGAPLVDGASVTAKVVSEGKAKKVIVFKYKPKKGYAKKQGHRQPYTKVVIEKIHA